MIRICPLLIFILSRLHNATKRRRTSCLVIITSSNCQDVTILKTCTRILNTSAIVHISVYKYSIFIVSIFLCHEQSWNKRRSNLLLWMVRVLNGSFSHERINYDFKITQTHSNNNIHSEQNQKIMSKKLILFFLRIKTFSLVEYGKNESQNFIPSNVVLLFIFISCKRKQCKTLCMVYYQLQNLSTCHPFI